MPYAMALSAVLLVYQTAASQSRKPAIVLQPATAQMDDVVRIELLGLSPKQKVTLRSQMDQRGQKWQAQAVFVAGSDGKVDVSKQAPSEGSYSGIDAMGLIWSMKPVGDPPKEQPPPLKVTDPRLTRFELEVDGKVVAQAELKRYLARPGVRVSDVHENGLVGKLFEPAVKGRRPALLVLTGSEGGIREPEAAMLASRGYTAFALAYFGIEGVPKQLVNIPLEYLKKGIDYLKTRDGVDADRLGVVGGSKGGELALVLGATFPEIKAVVAYVPSHVVWSGIGGTFTDPSWTYEGKPLPYVKTRPGPAFFAQLSAKKPLVLLDLYVAGLKDEESVSKALIPVEKIKGSVLLVSGGDDQMWPSALMADKVMERLKEHKHPHPILHLKYAKAGHGIPTAYAPLSSALPGGGRFELGGTDAANAEALADSRPKMLEFLKKNLDRK
ncbi:MAG: acyl-CoA thioesterase/BAAT N-terminal domain-containing protein [Gemmataceae bacterium]|nr:acyl-CoA thioesterase/BAAT N-terminal domain-containing protein [Gemmataceae bacterium]